MRHKYLINRHFPLGKSFREVCAQKYNGKSNACALLFFV